MTALPLMTDDETVCFGRDLDPGTVVATLDPPRVSTSKACRLTIPAVARELAMLATGAPRIPAKPRSPLALWK